MTGAGGAIGGHLVKRLLADGHMVLATDIKHVSDWWQVHKGAINLGTMDCSERAVANVVCDQADWVFNLAENMGGIGYITAERIACSESVMIGMRLLRAAAEARVQRFFFASSACAYNTTIQDHPESPALREPDAWPARPEDGYGLAKLYIEELCRHYRELGLLDTRVARYHNVYGPHGTWAGGREKAPAALCRKVAEAVHSGSGTIEVWGDGQQTRSYLFVEDCVEGTLRLMDHPEFHGPVNIGSDRLISVDDFAFLIAACAETHIDIVHIDGPQGVRGRSSDNTLCKATLGWEPAFSLEEGIARLYPWVEEQVVAQARLA